ncbi:DUF2218 domain-containing protein [Radicibacter daui]|uniref:DUF2218 domain-containing protein n=1 Tax=Radicibacter daui TaxID=3064829 RepID=UPI004046ECBC
MTQLSKFSLSGIALPQNAEGMLDEICEHFVEHSEVRRTTGGAWLKSDIGEASIRLEQGRLLIELASPSEAALQMSRNILAEHLYYFAGEEPFELSWSVPAPPVPLPNIHEVTVVSAENVTPHMRRVKFACADVAPFIGDGIHVRLLVPPKGRAPVWPSFRADGRIAWPEGEDELLVRVYTIRAVDVARRELWIDFLQHPAEGVPTPGADFARDVLPGERVALMGPGGGGIPQSARILLAGDEAALPAMARIVAEVPAGTRVQAIIEVADAAEEQPLACSGELDLRWLHRACYPAGGASDVLAGAICDAIRATESDTYVWIACERSAIRPVRELLKERGHDRKQMYVAWYWERQ